ncbi:MAG: hypothetical protein WBW02_13300 [Candidatus Sulfotelmatobacter sp.]
MNQSSFGPTIDEYLRKGLMPVEGHDPAIGRHRYGDSPQLSYGRQAGNYLEAAFEELGQIGNGKS